MDEPWRLPAEVMCRVQREKTWYSGQRGWILSPCQGQNGNPGLIVPVRSRLLKTGGQLVQHARYYWLLLAEGHLNRMLFSEMLSRIWALHRVRRLTLRGGTA